MTETENINNTILSQLIELASAKDLGTILSKVLAWLIDSFQAEVGSIFFQAIPPEWQRIGSAPEPLLDYIDQIEQAVAARLQVGVWRVTDFDQSTLSVRSYLESNRIHINTPLLKKNRVVGSLSLVVSAENALTADQKITLAYMAQGIGQLGSLAAELTATQKRYRELDLLHQTSQVLTSTLDVNELLEKVMHLTANVLDAGAASILLLDETKQALIFEASHSPQRDLLYKQRISINEGVVGWVACNNQPTIVNDVENDFRFNRKVDTQTGFLTESIAAVPLRLKGEVIGVLEALNKESGQGFDEADLRLMTAMAAQAAMALENARLYQNLREERDKIITAQETERHALARTLHDGAVQQFSAISMNLDYLQKLMKVDLQEADREIEQVQALALKGAEQARMVLFELRPIVLETEGLLPTLERYVDQLNHDASFRVQANLSPLSVALDIHIAGTIFSIIQEAVNNAKRHAQASNLSITVSGQSDRLSVRIQDDGLGFDVSQVEAGYAGRNSLGLLNMKERAALIEAGLAIASETHGPQTGTTITLSIPLNSLTSLSENLSAD